MSNLMFTSLLFLFFSISVVVFIFVLTLAALVAEESDE